jgi:hypothetical protein
LFRFIDEQAAQPICRSAACRNAWWMHVETLRSVRKHPRSRPLLRPESNPAKNAFVAPHELPKKSSVTLGINRSRENFHARNPRVFDFALLHVCVHKFSGLDPSPSQLLRKRGGAIVASAQSVLSAQVDALPKIFFALAHSFIQLLPMSF